MRARKIISRFALSTLTALAISACGADYSERVVAIDALSGVSADGAGNFETKCQECHEAGTFGAPDFREGTDDHPDTELIEVILGGKLLRMPSFADEFSDQEVADLVAYIRSLSDVAVQ